jgi:hypothetical protein
MVTLKQALESTYFHQNGCRREIGPRGGVTERVVRVRRNGKTKIWKRRPREFRVPVKYGLKQCFYIKNTNAGEFHAEEECQLEQAQELFPSKGE